MPAVHLPRQVWDGSREKERAREGGGTARRQLGREFRLCILITLFEPEHAPSAHEIVEEMRKVGGLAGWLDAKTKRRLKGF